MKKQDRGVNGKKRIYTLSEWTKEMSRVISPELTFSAKNNKEYTVWHSAFSAKLRQLLGPFPSAVPLESKIISRRVFSHYIREKVIYNSERFMSVPAWIFRPRYRTNGEKFPVVICCHGHGEKGDMAGVDKNGRTITENYGKKIGMRLAQEGFFTISPDFRVFGERKESREMDPAPKNLCDLGNIIANTFGYNLLTLNIWDGLRTLDYLSSRDDTDMSRVGCVGCSFGGTMALFLSAITDKITASCVSGYLSPTAKSLIWSTCGSQTLPGLLQWGDRAEIAGLICPRPLLIQIGKYDSTFPSHYALKEFKRLKRIYASAGEKEMLALDLFEGVHEINFPGVLDWFNRWLKKPYRSVENSQVRRESCQAGMVKPKLSRRRALKTE